MTGSQPDQAACTSAAAAAAVEMKLSAAFPGVLGWAGSAMLAFNSMAGTGFPGMAARELQDFDRRAVPEGRTASPATTQLAGLARLRTLVPGARVDWDERSSLAGASTDDSARRRSTSRLRGG